MSEKRVGQVDGKHYTEYAATVRELERSGRLLDAELLLRRLIEAMEAEARARGGALDPWYYERLAIDFRKQKRYADEIEILEQYRAHLVPESTEFADRLMRARELWAGKQGPLQAPAEAPVVGPAAAPVAEPAVAAAAESEPAPAELPPAPAVTEPAPEQAPVIQLPPHGATAPPRKRRSGCLWFFLGAAACLGLLVALLI